MPPQCTAVSAPGKVLLAGGYLVLDRAYTGLVFGLSARIHVLVEDIESSEGVELKEIQVVSPQFQDASWNYGYHMERNSDRVEVVQLQGTSSAPLFRNPFVETTLQYALTYLTSSTSTPPLAIKPLTITILADNDYYSTAPTASTTQHRFSSFPVPLSSAHKTGLGSSAALVTALTSALLTHHLPSPPSLQTLHNLAQAAHCAAQGKVGSGFDVAAAVYGTCIYRRFSPSILSLSSSSPSFAKELRDVVDDVGGVWDTEVVKEGVKLPDGTALVMCDVDCGSQTVGMVKQVLAWRKSDPDASKQLWDSLQTYNTALASALTSSASPPELEAAFSAIRQRIRKMGDLSGVPIEPPAQTELLDSLTAGVEGVVGGVVPGAGGYDAVALLINDDAETKASLTAFLQNWSQEKKGNVKLLGAKGELEGAKVEDVRLYKGFSR